MKPDEKTVKLFENDRFATENGAVIEEVEEHYAQCSLKLGSRHRNAMGAVMGGVYFTLADFAFAVAANWQGTGTVSLHSVKSEYAAEYSSGSVSYSRWFCQRVKTSR